MHIMQLYSRVCILIYSILKSTASYSRVLILCILAVVVCIV